ncbi:MAG: antitoxin [Acidimicrobiales bacterium]
MRTTLEIDDALLAAARTLAAERGTSLGRAVSDLMARGLAPRVAFEDDLPVFAVGADAPPITPEMLAEALDEW